MSARPSFIGARIRRREDPSFLTGHGRYTDDIPLANVLHVAFCRSTEAHALIRSIEVDEALAVEGVRRVVTAADLEGIASPLRALCSMPTYHECDQPVLAGERVRYVGEPIAAVVASSRYEAEDGVEAIVVEYDPLRPILTIDAALADGVPPIHSEVPGNLFFSLHDSNGDVEAAFRDCAFTLELELESQRYCAVALEARVTMAEFDPGSGQLTVWSSSQVPHLMRTALARALGLNDANVRVISPDVGGGFGPKCCVYPEDVVIGALAMTTAQPVKWVSDRREDLLTTGHGREQRHRIEAAVDGSGRVRAIKVDIFSNNGAYAPWLHTAALDAVQASENIPGPYDIPALERHVHSVVTNKAMTVPYRGVGRVSACFSIERLMDKIAQELRLSPFEIRRRNLVTTFPHETPTHLRFESGDYVKSIELLEETLGWSWSDPQIEELREQGLFRGAGIACAVEHAAHGPREMGRAGLEITMAHETAAMRVDPDGRVQLAVGTHSHGQGHKTTFAQIAADELGIDVEDVDVVYGDTALVPYGMGTWASRSTVYAGGATVLAARDVRGKILEVAADMLEANPDDLDISQGVISTGEGSAPHVTLADVARRACHEPHLLPAGLEPGLQSTRLYRAPDPGTFAMAMHGAVVEIDVAVGSVKILRYVVVEDCGTLVNPLIVEGQIHGGVAQGIGGALLEHLVYDESGQLVSGTLMDYLLPGFTDVPHIEVVHVESPSPHTLGGFKGMGEGGAINAPSAIVAAIGDALAPLGIFPTHTPVTPDWIVRKVAAARGAKERNCP
jgi:carbon-monoxide dehydrogenase large subunit